MSASWKMALKVFGFGVAALLANMLMSHGSPVKAEDESAKAVYLTDMSRCRPATALSPKEKQGRWRLIPYETVGIPKSGTMIGATSFVDAPDVTLPLNVTGWHAVYVGFWNPHYAYDGGTVVKVKLSDDPCFTCITEPAPAMNMNATYIKEAPFKAADLTGRNLQFGKRHGPSAQKAYIAYVKLVPLSARQVADLKADRARKDTRVLQVSNDGSLHGYEFRTREHIIELVEPYRYSDVGKLIWAVCYGDLTNYPTKVGTFVAGPRAVPIPATPRNNSYMTGEKTAHDNFRSLAGEGIIPVAVAAQHAHEIGLKFDIMIRMGVSGAVPPQREWEKKGFVATHPQFRQVMRDGTPVEKASYAFPEVRNLMVSIVREAAEKFDVDGVNLCFVRGPQFMAYEQPVLDDFRKEYGEDGRKVGFDDAKMCEIRSRYLNAFVRDVRRTLDEVGKKKGKRLELSAWVLGPTSWPEPAVNHNHRVLGMDVEHWIKQGWLDSVISEGDWDKVVIDHKLLAVAKAHKCQFIFNRRTGGQSEVANVKQWVDAYSAGVDGVAVWDINPQDLSIWPIIRRAGHRKELEAAAQRGVPALPSVRLKTIGGCDVLQGLGAAVYSGG